MTAIASMEGKKAILEKAVDAVKDAVGKSPVSFRAPYMKADEETISLLPELGIAIDSSRYVTMSGSLMPKRLSNGVMEIPVPEGTDASGKKISAYLWPMHELKRKPEDYIGMASAMEEGVFVIATHTWHMVESREKGMMSSDEIKKNIDNVREVIEGISDMNTKPMTLMGILHSDLY